ncbi:MAG: SurA N-terminal domain-containing protein [Gammaproteobacteria bacterium]|nr:SurA N-terminal domain-containing protein [Gammaproteobacteria bacterium]
MLQNIREKLTGWAAFAVILVIGVPLVLTFVGGDFTVTGSRFAARVNGEEIPAVEFQRVYQNRLVSEQQAARDEVPEEVEAQLKRETLDGLVLNRTITQYVRDAGYRVSASRVIDRLRNMEVFQVGGQFSRPAYDATLAAQGISPAAFEQEQQSILAVSQLQQGLEESSFFTPAEFRRLIALDQELRDVAYLIFDPRTLAAGITVTDVDVQAYYAANANEFQSPETATVEYLEVALADMATDFVPDEEALRGAYDADPTRFRSDEERRARHILIAVDDKRTETEARTLADEIAGQLSKGGDFAALAAKYSSDAGSASRGGDLGFAAAGSYVEPFEKALFALSPGETSAPVKTEFGYHIIRLDEVRAGLSRSFEEVRPELIDELRAQKAQDEFYALAERLDDLALENPTSLDPVARDTGLVIKRVKGFTRDGGGPLGKNASFITAVFSPGVLEGSENTPLIEIDDAHAVVARVSEYEMPSPMPLESVRGEIVERLRAARAATEASSRGQTIVQQVRDGKNLSEVLTALGLKLTEAGPLTRRSPAVHPDLLSGVFRAARPAGKPVVGGVSLSSGGYAVFELRSVVPGDPESIPQDQRDELKQAMARRAVSGETGALAEQLRDSADVVVAPDLFKTDEADAL